MQAFLSLLNSVLPAIASAAVIGVSGFVYKKAKGFRTEHATLVSHLEEAEKQKREVNELRSEIKDLKQLQESQNAALRELLGKMLDDEHKRLVQQGYASPAEKLAFEKVYRAYHGLGGNGTRTAHFEDVISMNSYPSN